MSEYPLRTAKPTFTHLLTGNFEEIATQSRGWNVEYNQLSRGRFQGGLRLLELPGIQLSIFSYNRVMHIQGHAPPGTIAFAVNLVSHGSIKFCGHQATQGELILAHPASEGFSFNSADRHTFAVLVFSLEKFIHSGRSLYHREIRHLEAENLALRVRPDHLIGLRRRIEEIFELLTNTPYTILAQPLIQGIILGELTEELLRPFYAEDGLIHEKIIPPFRREAVKRAQDYIEGNLREPLSLGEICQAAGASCRTLFYGFHDIVGLSPKAYLKARRLNAVRRELLRNEASVSTVFDMASSWGFWHMGQFGRDYKAMFGELPSETMTKGRKP
jgi:AraC family transcriptional regulator, ethanolamine operon transcriptional activator